MMSDRERKQSRGKQGSGGADAVGAAMKSLSTALANAMVTGPDKSSLLESIQLDLSPTDRKGWSVRARDLVGRNSPG